MTNGRRPYRDRPGDEVWYSPDGEKVYRQPDNAETFLWVNPWDRSVVGTVPLTAQDAPGRPEPATVAAVAATPPEPIPVTRGQRLRNLMVAVRTGDRSAVDALREALMGHD